jgi:hypothetical protein
MAVGLSRSCAVFTSGEGRKRASILIKNKIIDTLLLTQLSTKDTMVVETKGDNASLLLVSMYFDRYVTATYNGFLREGIYPRR